MFAKKRQEGKRSRVFFACEHATISLGSYRIISSSWNTTSKIDVLRTLLACHDQRLTSSSRMIEFIPTALEKEKKMFDLPDLRLELAALIHSCVHFFIATYFQGDMGYLYLPAMKGLLRSPRL